MSTALDNHIGEKLTVIKSCGLDDVYAILTFMYVYIYIYMCVCVCMCVCVWERERERESYMSVTILKIFLKTDLKIKNQIKMDKMRKNLCFEKFIWVLIYKFILSMLSLSVLFLTG